ncbi:hypothetical protein B0H14DRAFT_2639043 [Mycena olivaceomarginata]|nr:hypothetical protein B0H14DRAFT_2639043 [Mycena olivaceomarginata]
MAVYEVEWALYQQMKEDEKRGCVAEALRFQGVRKQELSEKDDAKRACQCLVSVDTVEIHQIWWCRVITLTPPYYYSHLATPSTPNRPRPVPSAAPPAYTTGASSTPSHRQAVPSTPSTPSLRQASPIMMIGHGRALSTVTLTSALAQFTAMSSRGPAELLTAEDARQATHFASGFPRAKAALISQAERASNMWLGHDPPDWTHLSDMARCHCQDHVLLELREVLCILDGLAEDSDAEEFQDGRLVYEVESDGDD